MTRLKCAVAAAALLVGLATPTFAQNGPAGAWDVVIETPQGPNPVTMTITITGDKAEGTMASAMGTIPITGTAKADSIEMSGNLEIQGMAMALGITGKVTGNEIAGGMKFGDFGEAPFTGKRAAAKETASSSASASPAASAIPSASTPATAMTGVAGKWNVTLMLTGMGEFPLTATLTQSGDDITGMISSMAGEVAVKGTFKAAALNLEFTADTPQGPMKVTMTGELKDQNLTGKANIAGMGEADWKAVRGQ